MKKNIQKFVYLENEVYSNTWINGGKIPIKLASSYKSEERKANFTPDENLIYNTNHSLDILKPFINIEESCSIKNININNTFMNGKRIPEPFCLVDMGVKSG